ncbi:50S ribosomal protein L11 methyltransferase [Ligilactobacillus ceti]|nr:50S ribosomal protein L11 methyltransferase [Ligilactobacillus ceti]
MEWTELVVVTTNEAVEAVSNILMEHGAQGVQIKDETADVEILTYFPADFAVQAEVPAMQQEIQNLTQFGLAIGKGQILLKENQADTWTDVWEKYYQPIRISRYLTIVPSWEEYQPAQPDEKVLYLNPQRSFGTGQHLTTQLSLHALEMTLRGGESMLDVGTGSGVLSIAAAKLGAKTIAAYDIDAKAIQAAQENVVLNQVQDQITLGVNDLLNGITAQVDVIVANILPEFLVPLIPQTTTRLNQGGKLILSGIINEKKDQIVSVLNENNYQVLELLRAGDWYGIVAELAQED